MSTGDKNIVVCSLSIGEKYKETMKYPNLSKIKYCEKHNYTFIEGGEQHYQNTRHMTWSKVKLMIECLIDYPESEYLVWIDADAMIMNDTIRLEDIICEYMGKKTFMMSRDNGFLINTGVWFVKNNAYALYMLNKLYDDAIEEHLFDNYAEQGFYTYLYDRNVSKLGEHSVILHTNKQHVFNCSYCFYQTGNFIVHYLGMTNHDTIRSDTSFMYQHQRDDETEEAYKNRVNNCNEYYKTTNFERYIVFPQRMKDEAEIKAREEAKAKAREEAARLAIKKICVCTLSIGEKYKECTKYGHNGKRIYCKKWGYGFEDDETVYDTSRHPAWSKVRILQKCLNAVDENGTKKYDFVVWMDADTLVMNEDIKLESFIDKYLSDDSKHFLVSRDNGYRINTGVWFLRNSEYAADILEKVWDNTTLGEQQYWEQGSFCYFHDTNQYNLRYHTVDLSTDYQKEFNCSYCFYTWGYFLVHFLYFRDPDALSVKMNEMSIYQKDNETEEEYKRRYEQIKDYYSICLFQRHPPS